MKPAWRLIMLLSIFTVIACGGGDGEGAAFSDDFDTPGGWRTISDPEVEIAYVDGGLSIEIKVLDRAAWTVSGHEFRDAVVSVDATPIGGPDDNAYGLIVRHLDDRRFYRFEVSADGFFAVQAPQGALGWEFLVDWTPSPAIHKGRETNRLTVECRGERMTFYANDVELTQVVDDRFSEGDVGVIAGTFYTEAGTHVLFDNFEVEPIKE